MTTMAHRRGDRTTLEVAVVPAPATAGFRSAGPKASAPLRSDHGQATVELLAFVPLLVAVTLLVGGLLAGYAAREAADQAAVAAAVASLQETDPTAAVKAASPGWARSHVKVERGRATVVITPRLPRFVADQIDAEGSVVFDPAAAR